MSEEGKHEKYRFWRWVEERLIQLLALFGTRFSDESLRIMKRIYRKLRRLILENELAIIDRKKEEGRMSPKQARSEKAKVRKTWQ